MVTLILDKNIAFFNNQGEDLVKQTAVLTDKTVDVSCGLVRK
jgi:hypothetical protein